MGFGDLVHGVNKKMVYDYITKTASVQELKKIKKLIEDTIKEIEFMRDK